jgi:hypothetical protein
MVATSLQIWIQAILTIAITSLAWKDQPVSKVAEHIYVGVITANLIVQAWGNITGIGIAKIRQGAFLYIFAIILGIVSYARYTDQYFWLYRYPIALVVGIGVGVAMRGLVGASFIDQVQSSFYNLYVPGEIITSLNNIIQLLILLSCLLYFSFTIKQARGPIAGKFSTIGRYALMAAFGYSFANTVATRINQYAGRISFLILEWLQLGG